MTLNEIPAFVQTEDRTLIRDTHSKALLCTDKAGLLRSRMRAEKARKTQDQLRQIEDLQTQVNELRALVSELLNR